jgi:hypothetical protein
MGGDYKLVPAIIYTAWKDEGKRFKWTASISDTYIDYMNHRYIPYLNVKNVVRSMEHFVAEGLVDGLRDKKAKKMKIVVPIVPLLDVSGALSDDDTPTVRLFDRSRVLSDDDDDDTGNNDVRERGVDANTTIGVEQRICGNKYRRVSIEGDDDDDEGDLEILAPASSSSSASSSVVIFKGHRFVRKSPISNAFVAANASSSSASLAAASGSLSGSGSSSSSGSGSSNLSGFRSGTRTRIVALSNAFKSVNRLVVPKSPVAAPTAVNDQPEGLIQYHMYVYIYIYIYICI